MEVWRSRMIELGKADLRDRPARELCFVFALEFIRVIDAIIWALDDGRRCPHEIRAEALELADKTPSEITLPARLLGASGVLELYRYRWQIELAFKRLKQLLKLGHLPHQRPDIARTWILAKLVVALLLESLYRNARVFSSIKQPTPFGVVGHVSGRYDRSDISRLRAHGQGVHRAAYWWALGFPNLERARAVQAASGRWNGYAVAKLEASAAEAER